jgi:hypothetical protein
MRFDSFALPVSLCFCNMLNVEVDVGLFVSISQTHINVHLGILGVNI